MSRVITIHTPTGSLSLPEGSTLADALVELQLQQRDGPHALPPDSVATAVNGDFVPRTQRAQHRLHDGDTVLCFAPITGG